MAGYEQGIMRVLAESRSQPELEGIGALPALASIVNRQRSQRLLIAYLVHVTGGDPALPQKVAFAFDRISAILELPGDGPIEPYPDAEVRQLVEAIPLARDAIRQCAERLGAMGDTDEALGLAAVPSQHANGAELRAACDAALDAHDAALMVLARWCDEHPGKVRDPRQL